MAEDQSSFISGFPFPSGCSEASGFSGDIPQEDWNHAWALIYKYPPQIVLWIIRELHSSQPLPAWTTFATNPLINSTFSSTPSCGSIQTPSLEAGHNSQVSSHIEPSFTNISYLNDSSLRYGSADLNSFLRDDVAVTYGTEQKFEKEQTPTMDANEASNRQSVTNIPNAQTISTFKLTAQNKDDHNQLEKRWFCVYDEHKGKSFGKTSDWKKHMDNFHRPGKKAWQCSMSVCRQIFDTASNFNQHHRKVHNCRKSCRHSDSAKTPVPNRHAFACGCRSCQALLFNWDEWRNHVAQHMESGMTISQWQYNTLLRNLLRRPEIHPCWEKLVTDQVYPYNVPVRFYWRLRNTTDLKWQLEYLDGAELSKCAPALALRAYETGLEVRSAQELMDSSGLAAEPISMQKLPQYSPPSLFGDPDSQTYFPSSPIFHQESQGFRTSFQDSPSILTSAVKCQNSDLDDEQLLEFATFASTL